MGRTLSYIVTGEDDGLRIDALAAKRGLYPSRSIAARYIDDGRVYVNGKPSSKNKTVAAGDSIVYDEEDSPVAINLIGQAIDLDVRYEDDYLIVLSKQAGLVCHPSDDHKDGTLVNALINRYGVENLCNIQGEDNRLGIVHRLDMDTTGLMLAAKSDEVGLALMEAIRDRRIDRHYITLVQGNIAHDSGMIDAPIARSVHDRKKMAVRDCPSARDSLTTFKVLERFEAGRKDDGFTLLECKLMTGRTHQIRVHMHYIKHPVVGDPFYGGGSHASQLGLERQFLHSWELDFTHPINDKPLHFTDRLPEDLAAALQSIVNRSRGRTEAGELIVPQLIGDYS